MPKLEHVLESALYTEDMTRARTFYETVLELQPLQADHRFTAYPVGSTMLLLFQQGETGKAVQLPGDMGTIPAHDGAGAQHLALAIAPDELDVWERHLVKNDIRIEGRTHWPRGGESIYFRDPDSHLLELATPGIWPVY